MNGLKFYRGGDNFIVFNSDRFQNSNQDIVLQNLRTPGIKFLFEEKAYKINLEHFL